MLKETYSQSGQDLWVLSKVPIGTYLEIGASHPIDINNTYLLEQNGWSGISIDIDDQCQQLWKQTRENELIIADALQYNYEAKLYDYIQIDIEPPNQSLEVLKRLLSQGVECKCMTFEHDAYYANIEIRNEARRLMLDNGYILAVPDVEWKPGKSYEDWFINKKYL
jgi:hypothetical protein